MGNWYLSFPPSFFLCQLVVSLLATQTFPKDQCLALIEFKHTFSIENDPSTSSCFAFYPKTSSWNMSSNCCLWDGVHCDEMTGHVIELDLGCSRLVGAIDSNSTLFQLSHLQRLDLSWNSLFGSSISPILGRFSNLTHLDLSHSQFSGQVPSEISHLSKLQSLHLGGDDLRLAAHDFKFILQNLTQLRELDLYYVDISSTIPPNISSHITTLLLDNTGLHGILPESIFHLPHLEVLDLGNNAQLNGFFPKADKWNSSASLRELDLSGVNFSGNLPPESLGYLTSLQSLLLDSCNLSGSIPKSLWNLTRIEYLELQNNHLEGPIFTSGLQNLQTLLLSNNSLSGAIPSWIFSLPSLIEIDLSLNHFSGQLKDFKSNMLFSINLGHNQLQGPLPKSLKNLVNLTLLDLSSNNFSGNVDISFFSNLKQLINLDLSYNSISLTNENKAKSTLPQSLTQLALSACDVKELDFLRSAKQLWRLDLSNNKIQGRIPDFAWSDWMLSMLNLNLSHNMLTTIDSIPFLQLTSIDLRSNFLQGSLPVPPPSVRFFFISNNNISGEIPSSICNLTSLTVLDLARNNLKGAIPLCLGNMSYQLEVLDMQQNSLSGNLPTTFSSGSSLRSLNLHGNKLEGKIPRSLANSELLEVLDLGNNRLNDTFPMWLGTLPKLQVLGLRSNKLYGPIRTSRIKNLFPQLRILDLSSNAFAGELPASVFHHLKALRRIDQTMKTPRDEADRYYQDSVTIVTKGMELEVVRILFLYTAIDLSNNKFEGHIPTVMGDLISLRVLNLSHNGLQGHIPPSLGNLSIVESLDLSSNQLSGEIPQQLASLTYLAFLNLSHNHLEGCIPKGPQFVTFENTSYEGNDGLRGFPVSEDCGSKWRPETNNTTSVLDDESDSTFLSELSWEVVLMGYGCGLIVGFAIGYVMLSARNPNWLSRIAEELEDKIDMRWRKRQQGQRAQHIRRNN